MSRESSDYVSGTHPAVSAIGHPSRNTPALSLRGCAESPLVREAAPRARVHTRPQFSDDCKLSRVCAGAARQRVHTFAQFARFRRLVPGVLREEGSIARNRQVCCAKCQIFLGVLHAPLIQSRMIAGRRAAVLPHRLQLWYTSGAFCHGTPSRATHPPRVCADAQTHSRCVWQRQSCGYTSGLLCEILSFYPWCVRQPQASGYAPSASVPIPQGRWDVQGRPTCGCAPCAIFEGCDLISGVPWHVKSLRASSLGSGGCVFVVRHLDERHCRRSRIYICARCVCVRCALLLRYASWRMLNLAAAGAPPMGRFSRRPLPISLFATGGGESCSRRRSSFRLWPECSFTGDTQSPVRCPSPGGFLGSWLPLA